MNIYICGQKTFGHEVLKLVLRSGHTVVGVSAPAEHPDGRHDLLHQMAVNHGLPVIKAGRLTAATLPPDVDLIVCAHSHDYIGEKTRLKARLGAIGYHPSLLPRHRGRDAIRWAIHMGDTIAGGTVYWLNNGVDAGPIAAQDWCHIRPDDTAGELWRRELLPMGLRLFGRVLNEINEGTLTRIPQDELLATWEPSWDRQPIIKPDLIQIGYVPGFEVKVTR